MSKPDATTAVLVTLLSEHAIRTLDQIARTGETPLETLNRILETILPIAADFDHFFGPPLDGRGPSGH